MNNINVREKSRLISVLAGSLEALFQNPVLFAPKLLSSFLGSLWFILVIDRLKSAQLSLKFVSASFGSMIALLFLGMFASVVVSAMVDLKRDYRGIKLLERATVTSWNKIREIGLVVLGVIGLLLLSYFILILGALGYYLSGNLVLLALAAVFSLILFISLLFYLYFVPVSLLKQESPLAAMKNSSVVSSENRRDVMFLMLFSFFLAIPALYFTGEIEKAGYVGFVVSRVVSGVVNTYVFTLSPEYYLSAESLD